MRDFKIGDKVLVNPIKSNGWTMKEIASHGLNPAGPPRTVTRVDIRGNIKLAGGMFWLQTKDFALVLEEKDNEQL